MIEFKYKYITVAETDKKDPETGKPLWTVKNNPIGLTCVPRNPADDPVIKELWV
jgi:hypothetical protein